MEEKELKKLFQEALKAVRNFYDADKKFGDAVKKYFKLNDKQFEKLMDSDGIVDPMQYATGSITWNEFKRYVKEVLNY